MTNGAVNRIWVGKRIGQGLLAASPPQTSRGAGRGRPSHPYIFTGQPERSVSGPAPNWPAVATPTLRLGHSWSSHWRSPGPLTRRWPPRPV